MARCVRDAEGQPDEGSGSAEDTSCAGSRRGSGPLFLALARAIARSVRPGSGGMGAPLALRHADYLGAARMAPGRARVKPVRVAEYGHDTPSI